MLRAFLSLVASYHILGIEWCSSKCIFNVPRHTDDMIKLIEQHGDVLMFLFAVIIPQG